VNKQKQEQPKSCALCAQSSFNGYKDIKGNLIGFSIVNAGCDDCRNYSKYEFDGLTNAKRWKQEK
jgi:hypothetical protein